MSLTLKSYIEKNDLAYADVVKALGITHASVSRYINGHRIPSESMMKKIYTWSNGQVEPNSFYDLPDLQSYPSSCAGESMVSSSKSPFALRRSSAQDSLTRSGKNFQYDLDHLCQAGVTA